MVVFHVDCLPYFQNSENSFEVYLRRPTNDTTHVELISCFFTASLTGQMGGWVGGFAAGEINNKR